MKIKVTVEVDISFDLTNDDGEHSEGVVDSDRAGQAVVAAIHSSDLADNLPDLISDYTGWCVSSLSLTTPEAECIDYLE